MKFMKVRSRLKIEGLKKPRSIFEQIKWSFHESEKSDQKVIPCGNEVL